MTLGCSVQIVKIREIERGNSSLDLYGLNSVFRRKGEDKETFRPHLASKGDLLFPTSAATPGQ